jgi:predicted ATPase
MYKIVISGGPHTGKTTLLEALESKYPGAYFVPEPATNVIEQELLFAEQDSTHMLRVPWLDYSKFGPIVTDKSVELEGLIPEGTRLAFQDRSLIDAIAYCRLNGFEDYIPEVRKRISVASYTIAFFCEPVGNYTATRVRRESEKEAKSTHRYLAEAYDSSGIAVVHLPAISVKDRLSIIGGAIELLQ